MKNIRLFTMMFVMSIILMLNINVSNASLYNINYATRESVTYSIPTDPDYDRWYTEEELKGLKREITQVHMRITYTVTLDSGKTNVEGVVAGYLDTSIGNIECYADYENSNKTLTLTTKAPLTNNVIYGYVCIGRTTDTYPILAGSIKVDVIGDWTNWSPSLSDPTANVVINYEYGESASGPWYRTEEEVLMHMQQTEQLNAIYIKATATTNVGWITEISIQHHSNGFVNDVGNSSEVISEAFTANATQWSIKATTSTGFITTALFSVSKIGSYGTMGNAGGTGKILINWSYAKDASGPWYKTEEEVLMNMKQTEQLNGVYIKATASTNMGNITELSIQHDNYGFSNDVGNSSEVISSVFTANVSMWNIRATTSTGLTTTAPFSISKIGSYGTKEAEKINIDASYGISENGPWHKNETGILNDIDEGATINKVYIKWDISINTGSIDNVKVKQGSTLLQNYSTTTIIRAFNANTDLNTMIGVVATSVEGTTKDWYGGVFCIGKNGATANEKINITIQYAVSESGPWYDSETNLLENMYKTDTVSRIFVKIESSVATGTINKMKLYRGNELLRETGAGIILYGINGNCNLSCTSTSSTGATNDKFFNVTSIGLNGLKEEDAIIFNVQYAKDLDSTWYETEEEVLQDVLNTETLDVVYVKVTPTTKAGNITETILKKGSVELERGESVVTYGVTENMNITASATSSNGKTEQTTINIECISTQGIRQGDKVITLDVRFGASSTGPWRTSQSGILSDVYTSGTVSTVYLQAEGAVDSGTITKMEILNNGTSVKTVNTNTIINNFTQNTSGGAITIKATSNDGNIGYWHGDITEIGKAGRKSPQDTQDDEITSIPDAMEWPSMDWDIRKNIDWGMDNVYELGLTLQQRYDNIPKISVARVGLSANAAIVSIKTDHTGESGYDIRYRVANLGQNKGINDVTWGNWQVYNGPFLAMSNMYVEAEGRYNENNPSARSSIAIVDGILNNTNAMEYLESRSLPLTSNKQYVVAYFGEDSDKIPSSKYYKIDGSQSTINSTSGNGWMDIVAINKGANPTLKLSETANSVTQESIPYKLSNAITITTTKVSNSQYRVVLSPQAKITAANVKEVGIIGEYTVAGETRGIVKKTNTIGGQNGTYTFNISNAPSSMTCRGYYINEANEMMMG